MGAEIKSSTSVTSSPPPREEFLSSSTTFKTIYQDVTSQLILIPWKPERARAPQFLYSYLSSKQRKCSTWHPTSTPSNSPKPHNSYALGPESRTLSSPPKFS